MKKNRVPYRADKAIANMVRQHSGKDWRLGQTNKHTDQEGDRENKHGSREKW